ncbi:PTS sugar transporter subunit IIA [Rhodococcus erythropolis]|uniref:PTS sugar transporter subunit IIA n=1 Tax=Rhodococcus erythropolis TaxID=1833 RepID=UPI0029493345|nr:PTS sugar transporter subunit IIA [Rhodococcus erythropolis]MDV6278618.1 PTS sugar transporter subunit IIA [Rhodococcus erythropolis]
MSTFQRPLCVVPDLVFINPEATDRTTLLTQLATRAHTLDYVHDTYSDALLAREAQFPTGVPSATPAAIPHADSSLVKKPGLGVALLPEPLTFEKMGAPGEHVDVHLVLLLLVTEPDDQAAVLASVVGMLQRETLIEELRSRRDAHAVAQTMQMFLT